MATYTTNYNLKKPAGSEYYDVEDQNGNMDLIDAALSAHDESIQAVEDDKVDKGCTWGDLKGE